jgi:hypothetical protein
MLGYGYRSLSWPERVIGMLLGAGALLPPSTPFMAVLTIVASLAGILVIIVHGKGWGRGAGLA